MVAGGEGGVKYHSDIVVMMRSSHSLPFRWGFEDRLGLDFENSPAVECGIQFNGFVLPGRGDSKILIGLGNCSHVLCPREGVE